MENDVSRFLAPSGLGPLLYYYYYTTSFTHKDEIPSDEEAFQICAILFIGCFCSLWMIRWHFNRKKNIQESLVGIPVAVATYNNDAIQSPSMIDESKWYEWTPQQVLTWISSLESVESSTTICANLAPERIPGSVLDALTVDDMRSMGIPYGPALRLEESILDLTRRYPTPFRQNQPRRRRREQEREWPYESHDFYSDEEPPQREEPYANGWRMEDSSIASSSRPIMQHDAVPVLQSHPPRSFMQDNPHEIDETSANRAQDLMKERFGLDLPSFRTTDNNRTNDSNGPEAENFPVHTTQNDVSVDVPTRSTATIPLYTQQASAAAQVPPSFLEQMPAHIREVASRRPDLVKKLLEARNAQRAVAASAQATTPALLVDTTEHEENDDDNDAGEEVFLLKKGRQQY